MTPNQKRKNGQSKRVTNMRISIFVSVAAIALSTSIGTVAAADHFATLNGVEAIPMSRADLDAVKGMDHHFFVNGVRHDTDQFQDANGGGNFVEITRADGEVRLAAPSYRGLILHACGNGVISGPSASWC